MIITYSFEHGGMPYSLDGKPIILDLPSEEEDMVKEDTAEPKEMVNHPEHYNGDSEYECIKVLRAWMTEDEYKGFLKGNALKYLCRVGKKDDVSQELKKAKWYLDKLVEEIEGND